MSYDLSRTLFSINGDSYSCKDFLAALEHYGILNSWKEKICEGKALVRKAKDQNLEIDLEEISEMTNEFRYSEKLLSSDEFNDYIKSISLSLKDFEDYLIRTYWAEHLEIKGDFDEEVKDAELFSEIYFSRAFNGLMDSWLSRLLAWYDEKEARPQSFAELEEHFNSYKQSLEKYFNADAWKMLDDESDEDDLREIFFDEVLKTLKVKYVS